MVDPAQLELIHAEIDGELDVQQRAALSRGLLADPTLRALRDDMRRLCAALDAVPTADPPAHLRADVLAALPQLQQSSPSGARFAPSWRYAAVLAGVLLTGTIVFRIMDFGQEPAANEMAGTLAAAPAASALDVVQLSPGAISGQVKLIRGGGELSLTLDLAAAAPVDVLIASAGRSMRVNGLGPKGSRGAGPTTIRLPGLGDGSQPVNVTFLVGDHEVAHALLREPTGY